MRSSAARAALPAAVTIVAVLALVAAAPSPAAGQQGFDGNGNGTTTFDIGLEADGDARVAVTLRLELDEDVDAEAFERLAREHTSGAEPAVAAEPFETAAAGASESTGRPMEVRDVSRSADRDGGTGRLSVAFVWTNFTTNSGDRLLLGDAFRTPRGTWLPELKRNQELIISFPRGYSPQSISMPGARYRLVNGTIHVEGPATFQPGSPSAVAVRSTQPTPFWEGLGVGPGGAGAALAAVLALVAGLGFVYREQVVRALGTGGEAGAAADPAPGGAVDAGDPGHAADVDVELLSDEERVLRLLEQEGGRMKQVDIVEETDWSNAKVSQLLSEMEDAGRVDKLRIGRENLISLPGEGPGTGAGNPRHEGGD